MNLLPLMLLIGFGALIITLGAVWANMKEIEK